uniref:HAD hydrolase family protein n=1 Tax=Salmonella enterica TaxID=28901 RepID=UPI0020C3EED1
IANTLLRLAHEHDIPVAQRVAFGVGANDLQMIKAAGLGFDFHAKPKVNVKTEITIRHADLLGVFCFLSGCMNL